MSSNPLMIIYKSLYFVSKINTLEELGAVNQNSLVDDQSSNARQTWSRRNPRTRSRTNSNSWLTWRASSTSWVGARRRIRRRSTSMWFSRSTTTKISTKTMTTGRENFTTSKASSSRSSKRWTRKPRADRLPITQTPKPLRLDCENVWLVLI